MARYKGSNGEAAEKAAATEAENYDDLKADRRFAAWKAKEPMLVIGLVGNQEVATIR